MWKITARIQQSIFIEAGKGRPVVDADDVKW